MEVSGNYLLSLLRLQTVLAAFATSYAPEAIIAGPAKGIIGAANLTTGLAICFAYLPNFLNLSLSFALSGLSILSAVVRSGLKSVKPFILYFSAASIIDF